MHDEGTVYEQAEHHTYARNAAAAHSAQGCIVNVPTIEKTQGSGENAQGSGAQEQERGLSLRLILALTTLVTVIATAAVVHISWFLTARAGIDQAVQELDREIVARVTREIGEQFSNASANLRALHTILFQRVISSTDAAKREFLFLAHLQSHPNLSWVSVGFPDGTLFGARQGEDGSVQMVELSKFDKDSGMGEQRIDHYTVGDGDIWFQRREITASNLLATTLPWYELGAAEEDANQVKWTSIHSLPLDARPAVSAALPLRVFDEFVGVLSVSVALDRIEKFLRTLSVGRSGTVFITDRAWNRVATHTPPQHMGVMLDTVRNTLNAEAVDITALNRQIQVRAALSGGGDVHYIGVSPVPNSNWLVVTVIPESDFLGTIEKSTERLALGLILLVATIGIVALALSRRLIDRPLSALVDQLHHIEALEFAKVRYVRSGVQEVKSLSTAMLRMTRALDAVVRFVPRELVSALVSEGQVAQPQLSEATLLYLDIEGFTSIGEQCSPAELVTLLSEFFTIVEAHIRAHRGVVMQFQGDAMLAAFNVPKGNPDHAACALRAAIAINESVQQATFGSGLRLGVRIGVNTGEVVAAAVGSAERADYTIHGDAVNLSARLEQLNKQHGSRIIASRRAVELGGVEFVPTELGEVPIRGKARTVTIYRLA